MKINSITKNNIQNNNPNFNARLQLSGNTNLLVNEGVATLQDVVSRIGTKKDIIDIALPIANSFNKGKANVNIAGYVNGALKQFTHSIEKTDILRSLIEGLKSNYVIKEVNFDAWKEVFDLEDEKTFEDLDRLLYFANEKSDGGKFRFNSVEDMLNRINAPITREDDRIIHWLATRDVDLLKLCLKHPNINVNVQECLGRTALHFASGYPRIESLKLLLERDDVDPTIKNIFGKTAEQSRSGKAYDFWSEYKKNGYKKFW